MKAMDLPSATCRDSTKLSSPRKKALVTGAHDAAGNGEMTDPDCKECSRLALEYRKATIEFLRLDDDVASQSPEKLATAKSMAEEAAARLAGACEALTAHQSASGHS